MQYTRFTGHDDVIGGAISGGSGHENVRAKPGLCPGLTALKPKHSGRIGREIVVESNPWYLRGDMAGKDPLSWKEVEDTAEEWLATVHVEYWCVQ